MSAPGTLGAKLSPREHDVLRHVAHGLQNADIGKRLHLSEDTVKSHLRRITAKLGARNRAHAVALAYARGLITPPGPLGCCAHCKAVRTSLSERRAVRQQMTALHPYALLYDRLSEIVTSPRKDPA